MAAFNEFEDQYILVLQPDEVACAEELAYVDTVLDPAAAAIETAEVYLEAQDPAIAHAPTVDDVTREREQHRLAARGRVEAGRDRVQTNVLQVITEAGRFNHERGEAVTPGLLQRMRSEHGRCWGLVKEVEELYEKWIAIEPVADRENIEGQ